MKVSSKPHVYVDTNLALGTLIDRIKQADRVALDTEADSLHHYYKKVCLIQLAVGHEIAIVDPLAKIDLSCFLEVLSEKPLVFHGAEYDLRMLMATFEFRPRNEVFDTMLAAELLGYERFSLAALVEHFFNVVLPKNGQRSDWSRRPLSLSQIQYAGDDARYLLPIAKRFQEELDKAERLQWHRESCERMAQATAHTNERDPEKVWRIKGTSILTRRQLAMVRELWHWRESEAQRADRPPFKILGNQALLDLAVWADSHPQLSLEHGPKLPRDCRGRRLGALKRAIRKAEGLSEVQWPSHRINSRVKSPRIDCKREIEILRAECARIANELGIAPSVLAPRAALAAIARHRPKTIAEIMTCSSLMKWQAELMIPGAKRILKKTASATQLVSTHPKAEQKGLAMKNGR